MGIEIIQITRTLNTVFLAAGVGHAIVIGYIFWKERVGLDKLAAKVNGIMRMLFLALGLYLGVSFALNILLLLGIQINRPTISTINVVKNVLIVQAIQLLTKAMLEIRREK